MYPLVLCLVYVLFGGWKKLANRQKGFIGGLCVVSLIVASFDITAAGILQRYMCDMAFGFALAAVFVIMILVDRYKDSELSVWIVKGSYLCVCIAIIISFLAVITSADSICLQNYNPKLFYEIAEYFKF